MHRYRIRPVYPDTWVVEIKVLFWWRTFLKECIFETFYPIEFRTSAEAIRSLKAELECRRKAKEHIRQSVIYYEL